jgi:hypothetical protein
LWSDEATQPTRPTSAVSQAPGINATCPQADPDRQLAVRSLPITSSWMGHLVTPFACGYDNE